MLMTCPFGREGGWIPQSLMQGVSQPSQASKLTGRIDGKCLSYSNCSDFAARRGAGKGGGQQIA
jgi:hypothetical protein